MDVIDSLKAELEQVNGKLTALEQMKNDKALLVAQAARLQKAITTLSGEPVVRKPMSDEAKARIKAGLEKARAAKVASATAPAAAGKKGPVAEKGAGRGAN